MKTIVLVLFFMLTVVNAATQAQESTPENVEIAVLNMYGGQILSSDQDEFFGRQIYVVRVLLSDSTIHVVQVDAETGEILDRVKK